MGQDIYLPLKKSGQSVIHRNLSYRFLRGQPLNISQSKKGKTGNVPSRFLRDESFYYFPLVKVHCRIFFIFSPCSFYGVTTSADPQKERTLSLGTFLPEACSNQPRKQRSDVNPTASSARSQTGILLSVLRQDYLNRSKRTGAVLFLLNSTSTLETGRILGRVSFRKGFWDNNNNNNNLLLIRRKYLYEYIQMRLTSYIKIIIK